MLQTSSTSIKKNTEKRKRTEKNTALYLATNNQVAGRKDF